MKKYWKSFNLGNKADCPEREVRKEDGERLAREYDVSFLETSAKTGLNVELAFLTVAKWVWIILWTKSMKMFCLFVFLSFIHRKLKNRKNDTIDESRFNVQDYVKEHTQRPSCPPCNLWKRKSILRDNVTYNTNNKIST